MLVVLGVAILLSIFSTVVMSYIAMAAAIGPWIETTLVLCSMLMFSAVSRIAFTSFVHRVGLTTAAGGIGGILATGFAFSLPTLYFISPSFFQTWVDNPLFFIAIFSAFAFVAGSFGFLIARLCQDSLLIQQQMSFPIGELVYNTILAPGQLNKAKELLVGFFGTNIFLLLQRVFHISTTITLNKSYTLSFVAIPSLLIPLTQFPLYIAIGFVTGHVIAVPLIAGFFIKILLLEPLYHWYLHPPLLLRHLIAVNALTESEFTFAFCSGMVLYSTLVGLVDLVPYAKRLFRFVAAPAIGDTPLLQRVDRYVALQAIVIIVLNSVFLTYFHFSFFAQCYLLIFASFCIYQMLIIAGKVGIVPLGRFATFVMIPGMLLFQFDIVQITLTAAFVEIAGGVAADVLFGKKLAMLAGIDNRVMERYQWLGLMVSSLVIGAIFWIFIYQFGLGAAAGLPATKAASRALLINFNHFDLYVLAIGLIFGYMLSYVKINSSLLLGAILMPYTISLMLIVGGTTALLVRDRERFYPLLSGISAGNSIWLLIQALL